MKIVLFLFYSRKKIKFFKKSKRFRKRLLLQNEFVPFITKLVQFKKQTKQFYNVCKTSPYYLNHKQRMSH